MLVKDKILLEYVWVDSNDNTRSKIKIIPKPPNDLTVRDLPEWNFDGSSTGQAEGKESDIIIKPCAMFPNPFVDYIQGYLVMCDCWNRDDTPHETNHRAQLVKINSLCVEKEPLFGIEQEYVIFDRNKSNQTQSYPYKWQNLENPGAGPQGPYYCSVGGDVCYGREISEKHLEYCLKAGLSICGTNAEVMASQWEYQIGPLEPLQVSDQLWISRYILNKISEKYDCIISFHPKPFKSHDLDKDLWNGSGGHTNFSTHEMRQPGGIESIKLACVKLEQTHKSHMEKYGRFNEERLSGKNETSPMDEFSWGISNRGKSIRIPLNVAKEGCGYLEDRRPGANLDPYLVCGELCNTVCLM